jgi:hypothetical protein
MAITPKTIIGTAVSLGRGAVGLLRRDETNEPPTTPATPAVKPSPATARRRTSGPPESVGAPKPGAPRGMKSATAPTAKAKSRPKAKPAAPRKKAPTSKSGEV